MSALLAAMAFPGSTVLPPPVDANFANVNFLNNFTADLNPNVGSALSVSTGFTWGAATGKFGGGATSTNASSVLRYAASTIYTFLANTDFTIEGWFKRNAIQNMYLFDIGSNGLGMQIQGTNMNMLVNTGAAGNTAHNIVAGAWNHFAMVRASGQLYMLCNGARLSSYNVGQVQVGGNSTFTIGNYGGGGNGAAAGAVFDGYRITKNVARYPGTSYTVPTEEFPTA